MAGFKDANRRLLSGLVINIMNVIHVIFQNGLSEIFPDFFWFSHASNPPSPYRTDVRIAVVGFPSLKNCQLPRLQSVILK